MPRHHSHTMGIVKIIGPDVGARKTTTNSIHSFRSTKYEFRCAIRNEETKWGRERKRFQIVRNYSVWKQKKFALKHTLNHLQAIFAYSHLPVPELFTSCKWRMSWARSMNDVYTTWYSTHQRKKIELLDAPSMDPQITESTKIHCTCSPIAFGWRTAARRPH